MKELVINTCHGGFGLSHEAMLDFCKRKGVECLAIPNARFKALTPYSYFTSAPVYEDASMVGDYKNDWLEYQPPTQYYYFYAHNISRDDDDLVALVEEWGERASGQFSRLKLVTIPDDVEWQIEEYDGSEWVAEKHRTWN